MNIYTKNRESATTFRNVGVRPANNNNPEEKTFIIETSKVPAQQGLFDRIKLALPEITHEGETYKFSKFIRGAQSNFRRFYVLYSR